LLFYGSRETTGILLRFGNFEERGIFVRFGKSDSWEFLSFKI
jgi:hypothetical protein